MAIRYKLYGADPKGNVPKSVQKTDGSVISSIPFAADNTDYQDILEWVAAGNTIEEAD